MPARLVKAARKARAWSTDEDVSGRRDAIMRGFVKQMLKAGLSQPKVLGEVLPALKLLRRRR